MQTLNWVTKPAVETFCHNHGLSLSRSNAGEKARSFDLMGNVAAELVSGIILAGCCFC